MLMGVGGLHYTRVLQGMRPELRGHMRRGAAAGPGGHVCHARGDSECHRGRESWWGWVRQVPSVALRHSPAYQVCPTPLPPHR